jgi:hypothetical protein
MGAVLMHPSVRRYASKAALLPNEPAARTGDCGTCESQEIDRGSGASLLGLVRNLQESSQVLIDYVDLHRDDARQAGIESIVIELTAISEGGKLDRIRESLEEAGRDKVESTVSLDGLSRVRRVERLVRDAQNSLARNGGWVPSEGMKPRGVLGQASSDMFSARNAPLIFGIVFGLVVVVSISVLAFRGKSSAGIPAYPES